MINRRAGLFGMVVGVLAAGGCSLHRTSVDDGVDEALASLSVKDLCETTCPVLTVDSLVRETKELYELPGGQRPVIRHLGQGDLRSLSTQVSSTRLGRFTERSGLETDARLMLYRVDLDTLVASRRLFGVAFFSPRAGIRAWHLLFERANGNWRHIGTRIFFEP